MMPGITVGVDGSDDAQRALEWAVKEAGLRHAPLTVLAVHQVAAGHWTGNPLTFPEDEPETERVRQAAEEAVQQAVGKAGEPGPASVTVRAVNGLAARELEKKRFFELADRLAHTDDPEEQRRLKDELAIMTFGE